MAVRHSESTYISMKVIRIISAISILKEIQPIQMPVLNKIMGIQRGDVYNADLIKSRIEFDRNGRDISTLYMDNGFLFLGLNRSSVV